MLEKSDVDVSEVLAKFTVVNLDVALISPTPTGLQKSIMDATDNVRDYLKEVGFHDYDAQGQGPDHKVVKPARFIEPTGTIETTVSFYRPQTKTGDPRIWFSRLTRYAEPRNLLAMFVSEGVLNVVNCSDSRLMGQLVRPSQTRSNVPPPEKKTKEENAEQLALPVDRAKQPVNIVPNTPLGAVIEQARPQRSAVVDELLGLLRDVSKRGYIQTLRPGPTGVGMTLETLLGIQANSSTEPDFKGIELKSKRYGGRPPTRSTLFSKVPNWKLSPVGSELGLLKRRGAVVNGRLQLYHTLRATAVNSYGLVLDVDSNGGALRQNHIDSKKKAVTHDATWNLPVLHDALATKHRSTFWIKALCRGEAESEAFHYVEVEHTKAAKIRNFDVLIETGVVTVDYTLSLKPNGKARNHGYLFKISPKDIDALFPPPERYDLR